MNKNVYTWMEGNGTVRTVFRKLALWEYGSPEQCKLQIIHDIEKENVGPSPFALQHAVERRKREIRSISLHLPLLAFISPVFVFYGAMYSHNIVHLYAGIGLTIFLAGIYRITCFSQYQAACRLIYHAADHLLEDITVKEVPQPVETSGITNFVQPLPCRRNPKPKKQIRHHLWKSWQ